ncbi:hypothetical protein HHL11_18070 [Ramlibacter sp. G-1-2-2]|uniref:Uncharacterized protein n=1 Tax=Ramlibacter agri TaxID=2728837 RepID=A0A848H8E8_9BURK|nr:hypothetical protein [Ramlibacter agri]NML45660.1 hypothetical protein [Ramlibacter agri]
MLHSVTVRTLVLAACGWLVAADASALSLGRVRGAALVGRMLEVTVPVTLEGTEGEPCADAEVFYGEQKMARASARWEPGPDRQGVVRIQSSVPVDEPVVTIYLRVGCGQSVSRRFVLLAEVPPVNEPSSPYVGSVPSARPQLPRSAEAPAPRPAPAPRSASPATSESAEPSAPPPRSSAQRATAAAGAPPAPPARGPRKPVASAPPADRLKIDLLDLTSERNPTLRLSQELQVPAQADPQARLNAAALWAALQRSPEDILQDARRQQALERDLQALRAQTQQNAAAVGEMRAQVEKARSERRQVSLLALAGVAVLAVLAALMGGLWWRARRLENVRRWFEMPHEAASTAPQPPAPAAPAATVPTPAAAAPVALGPAAAAAIASVTSSGFGSLPSDFHVSQGGTVRMVGVQELIDVHDKADFFFALGQHDQAIAILESHVHDQVETSALAWMDLLEQYHKLDRRADYERLRSEFRQRFAVQVPDFDHFDQPTSSLENYGRALSRIVALWPSKRVLNVIEESIFRKPGLPGAEPFSLEAYRELVLLYHIAKDVAPEDDSVSAPLEYRATDFPATSLQPLNTLDTVERTVLTRPQALAAEPPAAAKPALDAKPEPEPERTGTPPHAVPPEEATVVMGQPDFDLDMDLGEDRDHLMVPPSSPRIGLDIDLDSPEQAPRELPPLDFDTSEFDGWNTQDPGEPPPRR